MRGIHAHLRIDFRPQTDDDADLEQKLLRLHQEVQAHHQGQLQMKGGIPVKKLDGTYTLTTVFPKEDLRGHIERLKELVGMSGFVFVECLAVRDKSV